SSGPEGTRGRTAGGYLHHQRPADFAPGPGTLRSGGGPPGGQRSGGRGGVGRAAGGALAPGRAGPGAPSSATIGGGGVGADCEPVGGLRPVRKGWKGETWTLA